MKLLSNFSAVGLVGWLADFYLLATLLMLVAIVARRWIRQPAQRLTVHWIVAVELAVLAAVCAMPFWPRISLLRATAEKAAVETPIAADPLPMPPQMPRTTFPRLPREVPEFDAPATSGAEQPVAPPIAPPRHWSWPEMAAAAYLTSAGLVVAWLIWGALAAARACGQAENASDSVREELARIVGDGGRVPRLLVSSRVKTAVALGLRRPTILLPAGLVEEASPQAIRAVLTHEWAHIQSGDLWLLALGRCLLVLLFPHPLLWWLRRAIRGDQELLADAAAAGDNRPAYAEELLRLARTTAYPSSIAASGAVGIWESSSQLSRRIAMLLDESFHVEPRAPRRWRYRVLGVLVILGMGCSLFTFSPRMYSGEGASRKPNVDSGSTIDAPGNRALDAAESAELSPDDYRGIELPGYWQLNNPFVLVELKFTPQQRQKLLAIESWCHDEENSHPIVAKVGESDDKPMLALAEWDVQKKVEEVLTPAQAQAIKELTSCNDASIWFQNPHLVGRLKLTKEQQDVCRLLRQEERDLSNKLYQRWSDKMLSVLDPQQQARLRDQALGPLGPDDHLDQVDVPVRGEGGPILVFSLDPYPDFTQSSVRKELGLSPEQEEQVRTIVGGSATLAEALAREVEKLTPEELQKPKKSFSPMGYPSSVPAHGLGPDEVTQAMVEQRRQSRSRFGEQPEMKPAIALRKQFEALLTPKQLASYRDLTVRKFAGKMIYDPVMLRMVGGNDRQQDELQRFHFNSALKMQQSTWELGRKLLKVLTPEQKETIRRTLWGSGDSGSPAKTGGGTLTLSGTAVAETPAAKAAAADAKPAVNHGTLSTVTMPEGWDGDPTFHLPGYNDLCVPSQRKILGIELSDEQLKKLRAISTDFQTKYREVAKDAPVTAGQKEMQKFFAPLDAKLMELDQVCRKQVEAVLTPQQLQTYQEQKLIFYAGPSVRSPQARKSIGITLSLEQQKKLDQLEEESSQATSDEYERDVREVIAALNPQQSDQLRLAVEHLASVIAEWSWTQACHPKPAELDTIEGLHFDSAHWKGNNVNIVFEQSNLRYEPLVKKLGLSADQQKQLTALDAEHQSKTEKLLGDVLKLPPEERTRPEFREKAAGIRQETRQRIEAILTPQQWKSLKEAEFDQWAFVRLAQSTVPSESGIGGGDDGLKKIALDNKQTALLHRVNRDLNNNLNRIRQEFDRKAFDILTPQQKDSIRGILAKQQELHLSLNHGW